MRANRCEEDVEEKKRTSWKRAVSSLGGLSLTKRDAFCIVFHKHPHVFEVVFRQCEKGVKARSLSYRPLVRRAS